MCLCLFVLKRGEWETEGWDRDRQTDREQRDRV